MSAKRQPHGGGIYSMYSTREGRRVYRYQRRWTDPETGDRRKVTEIVPESYKRQTGPRLARAKAKTGIDAARQFKIDIDLFAKEKKWVPMQVQEERKQAERQRRKQEEAERALEKAHADVLRFNKAWPAYLKSLEDTGDQYARMSEARYAFQRLELFYGDCPLDEIKNSDVKRFYVERMTGTGAYAQYGECSRRMPDIEMNFMIDLYRHLQEDHDIPRRPWNKPLSRRKDSPFKSYKTAHDWKVPENDRLAPMLQAIFSADPENITKRGQRRPRVRDAHRALWMLCWHTAARPESEPCRLTWADVEFLNDGWATVSYTDAKNEQSNRTIPVPPAVADALRRIMPRKPTRFEGEAVLAAWGRLHVFSKRRSADPLGGRCWDKASYKRAWEATVGAVRADFPEVEGMWVRDFRKGAGTTLQQRLKVSEVTTRHFMGHVAKDVHGDYIQANDADLREAAEALEAFVFEDTQEAELVV